MDFVSFVFAGDAEPGESVEGDTSFLSFKVSFKTTKESFEFECEELCICIER